MNDALARLDATVHGRVQGVGFRYFVLRAASGRALQGWVANEPDGTVRCVAEGRRQDLEALLTVLQEGPGGARIDRVTTSWSSATGAFRGFTVRAAGHGGD